MRILMACNFWYTRFYKHQIFTITNFEKRSYKIHWLSLHSVSQKNKNQSANLTLKVQKYSYCNSLPSATLPTSYRPWRHPCIPSMLRLSFASVPLRLWPSLELRKLQLHLSSGKRENQTPKAIYGFKPGNYNLMIQVRCVILKSAFSLEVLNGVMTMAWGPKRSSFWLKIAKKEKN